MMGGNIPWIHRIMNLFLRFNSAVIAIQFILAQALVCTIVCGQAIPNSLSSTQPSDETSLMQAKECWEKIRKIAPSNFTPGLAAERQRWNDKIDQLTEPFWQLALSDQGEKNIAWFVDQFGKWDAYADWAWFYANPDATFPEHKGTSWRTYVIRQNISPERHRLWMAYAQVESLLCRNIVRRCLQEPAFLERYYVAVVWSQMLFPARFSPINFWVAVEALDKQFKQIEQPDYWIYARLFVLLAHATSRDDLLAGASPEKLLKVFVVWRKWLGDRQGNTACHLKLQPQKFVWEYSPLYYKLGGMSEISIPDKPFPDWRGPVLERTVMFLGSEDAWQMMKRRDTVVGKMLQQSEQGPNSKLGPR